MRLVIKRDQAKNLLESISFVLDKQVMLTSEEERLVRRYRSYREILYTKGDIHYTADDILNNKDLCKEACMYFEILLEAMISFSSGDERIIEL
jgi:hypothetical protein